MSSFEHILVPTDFGEPSERALDMAVELAQRVQARVSLLHTFDIPTYGYGAFVYRTQDLDKMIEDGASKKLEEELASLHQRVPTAQGVLKRGLPWEKILEAIDELGVDLVIMGTHGRRGMRRTLLGSVAEKVVRLAPVPVLTVHAGGEHEEKPTSESHTSSAE